MVLVPSSLELLQPLAGVMSTPSFTSLVTLLTGWVFARRPTVTGLLLAAGAVGSKHHSAFHRFFAAAQWSLNELGLAVFALIQPWLEPGVILLALDDTLARKCGKQVFGAGMHHDPRLSSRGMAVMNWGHSWVQLGVLVNFRFAPKRWFCLPILFRLYRNRQTVAQRGGCYRTRPELALEVLHRLCTHAPRLRFARVHAVPWCRLRVVAVESLTGPRPRQAFCSTDLTLSAEQTLVLYARRWAIEQTLQESKTHLGFEAPQGWTRRTVERTAPTGMLLYSLIVLWFAGVGHRSYRPLWRPWYTSKAAPSFADILATLRRERVRAGVSSPPGRDRGRRNLLATLIHLVQQAA